MISRRSLLGSACAGGIAAVSGCVQFLEGDDSSDEDSAEVVVINETDRPQAFRVRLIVRSGATVLDHEYRLDAGMVDSTQTIPRQPLVEDIRVPDASFEITRDFDEFRVGCIDANVQLRLTTEGLFATTQCSAWVNGR
ncbi:hypothetical protein U3A55_07375 [Salarchaeum sp. III]